MSQERLAQVLGVTFQQIQKYETGANRVPASRLLDISQALDLPVEQFFEGLRPGAGNRQVALQAVLATPEGVQLMRIFSGIKDRRLRQRIVALVRTLSGDA